MNKPVGSWVRRTERLWWYIKSNQILGFVRRSFDRWDAYIATGKKWPESERLVRFHLGPRDNPFFKARRAVEEELGYSRGEA